MSHHNHTSNIQCKIYLLLQFLFHCANDPNPVMKEAALQMFTSVPGVFGNEQNNYLDLIKQMMLQSLQPTEPFEVRFQAVRAVGAFILVNDKETQILKHFGDLLGPMLQIIAETVHQQDDDTLLKVLIDLAENAPKFLRPQLLPIYELCMKIFSDSGALDSWRQLALEVTKFFIETCLYILIHFSQGYGYVV